MTTKNPILYSFRRCPYAMRARMALYVSKTPVELREIVLRNKPDAMLKASPKGTVPVLVLYDGTVVDESLDIMWWAFKNGDSGGWLDCDTDVLTALIDENDTVFKRHLDRYKYPGRYPDEDCSNAHENGLKTLEKLEGSLTQHKYLLGDKVTMGDIAIFPFIRQFAFVDKDAFDALPYTALQKWLNEMLASDFFAAIMHKYEPWSEGDEPVDFGQAA